MTACNLTLQACNHHRPVAVNEMLMYVNALVLSADWLIVTDTLLQGGSVAEWLACWTQAQKARAFCA